MRHVELCITANSIFNKKHLSHVSEQYLYEQGIEFCKFDRRPNTSYIETHDDAFLLLFFLFMKCDNNGVLDDGDCYSLQLVLTTTLVRRVYEILQSQIANRQER